MLGIQNVRCAKLRAKLTVIYAKCSGSGTLPLNPLHQSLPLDPRHRATPPFTNFLIRPSIHRPTVTVSMHHIMT